MECCLPILCSSWKGSRLIPYALKCILYWWITIYDSRWYICVCVCAYKCIYLRVAIWHYVHANMAKEKSSELEKVLFLLVSFHQKVEKIIHFHLSYFLSSPSPFFFRNLCFLYHNHYPRIIYQSQVTGNYMTKPQAFCWWSSNWDEPVWLS